MVPFSGTFDTSIGSSPSPGGEVDDGLRELTAAVADLVSVSTLVAVFFKMFEKKSIFLQIEGEVWATLLKCGLDVRCLTRPLGRRMQNLVTAGGEREEKHQTNWRG